MKNSFIYLEEKLRDLKAKGLLPLVKALETAQGPKACFNGKEVINLSSNNYLGLITHPRVKRAAKQAIDRYGTGSGAARNIAGMMVLQQNLERELALFKNTEAAVVFQTGFSANVGTVSTVMGKDDVIVSDELNHASIIDGCRLCGAQIKIYPHKDIETARRLLQESKEDNHLLLITDGVFSMEGDIAPLPELVALARESGAIMMVDDAHAVGVLGSNGRGTIDHFGLHGQVDIQMGTFSKALGSVGGYVAGSQVLIDYLKSRARPILFSTSLPPAAIATTLAALDVIQDEPEIIDKLWENTRFFKEGLHRVGFDTGESQTPIIPVMVRDEEKAICLSNRLFKKGVYAQAIIYPAVPKGKARLRTIISAAHREEELDFALSAFAKIGRELVII